MNSVEKLNKSCSINFLKAYYFPRIIKRAKLGDVALLKEIIKILKEEKIKTISSLTFNPELTLKKGSYSKTQPDTEDLKDIKIAVKTLSKLNKYSFSLNTYYSF